MPFCNVKDDVAKIKAFLDNNKSIVKDAEEFNELLKSCVLMEAASFIGFWNVLMGYYLAKSMKDAMCKMCKGEEEDPEATHFDDHLKKVRMEPYVTRDKITKQEKADICFWLQYMNNLSNHCPSTNTPKPSEKNTYANMLPGMAYWGRPC